MQKAMNPIRPFLDQYGALILDGGLATHLETLGCDLNDELWSARLLLENPAIKEALVIGVTDAYHGEMPRAYVVLQPDATDNGAQLAEWLNARVGKHERVDSVIIRDDLPKTMIGKLDRKALRAQVEDAA